jgi:hypothetical protein
MHGSRFSPTRTRPWAQQIHIHTLPMMEKQAISSLFQLQGGRNDPIRLARKAPCAAPADQPPNTQRALLLFETLTRKPPLCTARWQTAQRPFSTLAVTMSKCQVMSIRRREMKTRFGHVSALRNTSTRCEHAHEYK